MRSRSKGSIEKHNNHHNIIKQDVAVEPDGTKDSKKKGETRQNGCLTITHRSVEIIHVWQDMRFPATRSKQGGSEANKQHKLASQNPEYEESKTVEIILDIT